MGVFLGFLWGDLQTARTVVFSSYCSLHCVAQSYFVLRFLAVALARRHCFLVSILVGDSKETMIAIPTKSDMIVSMYSDSITDGLNCFAASLPFNRWASSSFDKAVMCWYHRVWINSAIIVDLIVNLQEREDGYSFQFWGEGINHVTHVVNALFRFSPPIEPGRTTQDRYEYFATLPIGRIQSLVANWLMAQEFDTEIRPGLRERLSKANKDAGLWELYQRALKADDRMIRFSTGQSFVNAITIAATGNQEYREFFKHTIVFP